MNLLITRATLAVSGTLLGAIGSALMFAPQTFLRMSHVVIERDPGLLSELIAPSGVLMLTGAFMILSAIKRKYVELGLVCGAMVYGSYGVGRLISMLLHGVPSSSLIAAMLIEVGVAVGLSVLLVRSSSVERRPLVGTR